MISSLPNLYSSRGITLVEALVVIAIIGILAAVGIPSFNTLLENRRIIGAADNILSDLRYAQSEALKRNTPVFVDFSDSTPWQVRICTTAGCDGSGNQLLRQLSGDSFRNTTLADEAQYRFDPRRSAITNDNGSALGSNSVTLITVQLGSRSIGLLAVQNSHLKLCSNTGTGGFASC